MSKKPDRSNFINLLALLKEKGYKIKKTICAYPNENGKKQYSHTEYLVNGSSKNMMMVTTVPSIRTDNTCIFIDRRIMWDKISKCPVQLPLPSNEKEVQKILKIVDSIEKENIWEDISNEYDFDNWIKDYKSVNPILTRVGKKAKGK